MENGNASRPGRGLWRDSAAWEQPVGTHTFALNATLETGQGDSGLLSNEEGNLPCGNLKPGYVPVGKAEMGDGGTVVFSVSGDGTVSEIGVLDRHCGYTVYVNDAGSAEGHRLGFGADRPILAVYRLRRGCQRTVYFTDGHNRPRHFDLDRPGQFKSPDGTWNGKLFDLQKGHAKVPEFRSVEVLESGGSLRPGGYNVAVQYVDEGGDATEWIASSPVVQVYRDSGNREYRDVRGSTGLTADYLSAEATGKAIEVSLGNLDTGHPFYRLAFIGATSGTGEATEVRVTEAVPTSMPKFVYTGENAPVAITEEELLPFSDIVERAGAIAMLEGRLHLGNLKGNGADLCALQRYASRIKADCVTKRVSLSEMRLDRGSPKSPVHEFHGLGYMPGEIYSFGIVYLFADGTQSPVYHIPGKSPQVDAGAVFSPGEGVYPMSADNEQEGLYVSNSSCGNKSYWGRDSEGVPLDNARVRHHRFPFRSEMGIPLVETVTGEAAAQRHHRLGLEAKGVLNVPKVCPEGDDGCEPGNWPVFEVKADYTVGGQQRSLVLTVNPAEHSNAVGAEQVDLSEASPYHPSGDIAVTALSISDVNGDWHVLGENAPSAGYDNQHGNYFAPGATSPLAVFSTSVSETTTEVMERRHSTEILGVRFSGIDMPLPDDIGGKEATGYLIVRNERGEHDRTVLDSGVLVPTVESGGYIAHGLLGPETDRLSGNVYGLVHLEHKFNGREYTVYDGIRQEGVFETVRRNYGKFTFDDVFDGSTYDEKVSKEGSRNDDAAARDGSPVSPGMDGWSLDVISRDNILEFRKVANGFSVPEADIPERFYLDALEGRPIAEGKHHVYNIACDNKTGIVELRGTGPERGKLPYVALLRENKNAYANFRTLPYYRQGVNPTYFSDSGGDSCTVFSGDSYVSPLRYVNTVFYRNRPAKRGIKKTFWQKFGKILGPLFIVIGVALSIASGGTSLLLLGAGLGVMGAGALVLSSGIKVDNFNRTYLEEYEKGLREATKDDFTRSMYEYEDSWYTNAYFTFERRNGGHRGKDGPSDDSIQWTGDCLTDLWFESGVNASLRYGAESEATPSFLNAPGRIEEGNRSPLWTSKGEDRIDYLNSNNDERSPRAPMSSLENFLARKLLVFDDSRDGNRAYIGLALGELYAVNPDYQRGNRQKVYFHLPMEYDCCSKCREAFPHRWRWSEPSQGEDLADGFRVFLPNNYRDVDGETGEIANLFAMGGNLFLHTREALWMQPRSYQQQVTDESVLHIGTGELGSLPAKLVARAGLRHRLGALETPYGYFFVSEREGKVYRFDGQQVQEISRQGLSKWFAGNVPLLADLAHERENGTPWPYRDSPSHPHGTGFALGFDRAKNRVLFTKHDRVLDKNLLGNGSALFSCGGGLVHFPDYHNIVHDREGNGWSFLGMEGCRMRFGKTGTVRVKEERTRETKGTVPSKADIHVFLDDSGSFGNRNGPWMSSIRDAVDTWVADFATTNPNWEGTLYPYYYDSAETWLDYPRRVRDAYGGDVSDREVIVISFCNESSPVYHESDPFALTPPTNTFLNHYNTFTGSVFGSFRSFAGILYPIVTGSGNTYRTFPVHALAALYGTEITAGDIAEAGLLENRNPMFSEAEWQAALLNLQTANPYPDDGLRSYNWAVKHDRALKADNSVINAGEFASDVEELLQSIEINSTEVTEVEVERDVTVYEYEDGIAVEGGIALDASWTISYALEAPGREAAWASWHSYMPGMYLPPPLSPPAASLGGKYGFSSWAKGGSGIWAHGGRGYYQGFYGKTFPHIVEYVSLSGPFGTRTWEGLRFLTRAGRYDPAMDGFADDLWETFTHLVAWNARQCTGLLGLRPKRPDEGYLENRVGDHPFAALDRDEGIWSVAFLRDMRVDHSAPIWREDLASRQGEWYTDKALNAASIDPNKDWTEMEVLRDRYMAVYMSEKPLLLTTGYLSAIDS